MYRYERTPVYTLSRYISYTYVNQSIPALPMIPTDYALSPTSRRAFIIRPSASTLIVVTRWYISS